MCHSWGATARAHVQGSDVPDLGNGWTDRAQAWYIDRDRLVAWRSFLLIFLNDDNNNIGSIETFPQIAYHIICQAIFFKV